MMDALWPHQTDALAAIARSMAAGKRRLLCQSATGTGKTTVIASLRGVAPIADLLKDGGKMLVIAHREELLEQASTRIRKFNPGLAVNIEQGDMVAAYSSEVVVASIQTLAARSFMRLKALMKFHRFRLVVVDEAHHAAADTYRTALVHLGFLPMEEASSTENTEAAAEEELAKMEAALAAWDETAPKDRVLIGFTATPNRSDAIGLGCVFQEIAFQYPLKQAIADGRLAPITPWIIETAEKIDDVKVNRGEFNQRELSEAVNTSSRNLLAVDAWRAYAHGQSTIAFTVDVKHAVDLAAAFTTAGIRARSISGETPKDERRQAYADFLSGQITVLTNCMIVTEGVDLPRTACVLNAKPTKSPALLEQMIGRGLRLFPGKVSCVVIDMLDVTSRHSLMSAATLYGLPPGLNAEGKDLRKVLSAWSELTRQHPDISADNVGRTTMSALELKARRADLFAVPEVKFTGVKLRWIKSGDEYRIQYPWMETTEAVTVSPNLLGQFRAVRTVYAGRKSGGSSWTARESVLAERAGDTAAMALRWAEDLIRTTRPSIASMRSADARWRKNRPSEAQIRFAASLHIPVTPGMTSGELSDKIDVAKSRRHRR